MDSVPMLAITGQVNSRAIGTDAFQEADIVGSTMPFVKHSFMVTRPATPWLLAQEHLPWSRHSVELSGADPLGLRRRWSPHPECLCSELP